MARTYPSGLRSTQEGSCDDSITQQTRREVRVISQRAISHQTELQGVADHLTHCREVFALDEQVPLPTANSALSWPINPGAGIFPAMPEATRNDRQLVWVYRA